MSSGLLEQEYPNFCLAITSCLWTNFLSNPNKFIIYFSSLLHFKNHNVWFFFGWSRNAFRDVCINVTNIVIQYSEYWFPRWTKTQWNETQTWQVFSKQRNRAFCVCTTVVTRGNFYKTANNLRRYYWIIVLHSETANVMGEKIKRNNKILRNLTSIEFVIPRLSIFANRKSGIKNLWAIKI